MPSVFVGLAIEPPTGSEWDKRKDAVGWIANTEQGVCPSKIFTFMHCVATCNENFATIAATLLSSDHLLAGPRLIRRPTGTSKTFA